MCQNWNKSKTASVVLRQMQTLQAMTNKGKSIHPIQHTTAQRRHDHKMFTLKNKHSGFYTHQNSLFIPEGNRIFSRAPITKFQHKQIKEKKSYVKLYDANCLSHEYS